MAQESLTLYKLIILYMLNRVNFPLTASQVSDFVLEREYTNFLTLQQAIFELTESGLILTQSIRNRTHLIITAEGKNTLSFFENRVNSGIRQEIDTWFTENELELRDEVSILSDYYRTTGGEYEAHLTAKEKNTKLVDITLTVPTEESAAAICDNWQQKNQAVYRYLIEQLF